VIKTANVRRFELGASPVQYVSREFATANPQALVPYGSLLITATGVGSAGRTFVKLDRTQMLADGHVTIVALESLARASYLCAFLQSPIGRQQLLRLRRGSSRQIEIYPDDILSVLVPPLTVERRRSISRRWLKAAENVRESSASTREAEARIAAFVGFNESFEGSSSDSTWSLNVSDDERPMIPAVDVCVLEVDRSTVLPEYLALYLNSAIGRRLTASLQTGSSCQQHLYPGHFSLIPVPLPRTRDGRPDLDWQQRTVAIADRRVRALAAARRVGAKLDEEFLAAVGTPVDLSVLPS
jgi:restriction endonuclease S subunit